MEYARSELEGLLHDFGSKYVMETIFTSGKIRRQVVDKGALKIMRFHLDRKNPLPENVETIHYYKIGLNIIYTDSGITIDPYLKPFDLSELPPPRKFKLTKKGRKLVEERRKEAEKKYNLLKQT